MPKLIYDRTIIDKLIFFLSDNTIYNCMKYKLSYSTWGKEEETAIKNIINKSQLTMSKITQVFEEKFAKKLNRKYAVMELWIISKSNINSLTFL